jgi:N-acetylneuraminic acid mutarotase
MWGPTLGYVFDPASDTWANISSSGQPSRRYDYTAVWTGTEMIIWGGRSADYSTEYGDGARYNPATDTWQPISMVDAPSPRRGHTAVWTGTEMIVWGGGAAGLTAGDGARYNPKTNTWAEMSTTDAPVLSGHVAVWTGSKMVAWGSLTGAGGIYDPNANSWTATDTTCAPTGRLGVTGIWNGERMIVWGGWANNNNYGDGYEFDPVGNSWTKLSSITAPSARSDHTAIWTGTQMIIWAGYDGANLNTGGVFTP